MRIVKFNKAFQPRNFVCLLIFMMKSFDIYKAITNKIVYEFVDYFVGRNVNFPVDIQKTHWARSSPTTTLRQFFERFKVDVFFFLITWIFRVGFVPAHCYYATVPNVRYCETKEYELIIYDYQTLNYTRKWRVWSYLFHPVTIHGVHLFVKNIENTLRNEIVHAEPQGGEILRVGINRSYVRPTGVIVQLL